MKTTITKLTMLLIALFFTNITCAQTGNFEFLFDTDGDSEGFTGFSSGAFEVSGGKLTYTYGGSTSGFELNPPATAINLDKTNFPYIAIKLSHSPVTRVMFYLKTNGYGKWYDNKLTKGVEDSELNEQDIYVWDMSGDHFTDTALDNGAIERMIFALDNSTDTEGATSTDVSWIKTFASIQAVKDYYATTLSIHNPGYISNVNITSSHGGIVLSNLENNSEVTIYSLLGKELYNDIEKSTDVSIKIAERGVVILKIKEQNGVFTKKIIVE